MGGRGLMDYLDIIDLEHEIEIAEYNGKFDNDTKMVEQLEKQERKEKDGRFQI